MKYFIKGSYKDKLKYNLDHDMVSYERWFIEDTARKEIKKILKHFDVDGFLEEAFNSIKING